jgi:hypothetical protein
MKNGEPTSCGAHYTVRKVLTDDELVRQFESSALSAFPHAEHVRLTFIYLSRHGRDETLRKMYEGLSQFATAKGVPEKFHVTMTRAWVDLIDSARCAFPQSRTASALIANCPELLDRDALLRYYSPERLNSVEARHGWVPPDRAGSIGVEPQSNPLPDTPPGM